jgi:type I restriction enzyme M protein
MKSQSFAVQDLFDLMPGSFHATSELEAGAIPLISCGEENNGLIGYFDIPLDKTHTRALTVSFNGFPLTTNFHPYRFGAKDDVAVLVPLVDLNDGVLIYVASLLNAMKWRYSYGRKCYREKLRNVQLRLPVRKANEIDPTLPNAMLTAAHQEIKQAAMTSMDALIAKL